MWRARAPIKAHPDVGGVVDAREVLLREATEEAHAPAQSLRDGLARDIQRRGQGIAG